MKLETLQEYIAVFGNGDRRVWNCYNLAEAIGFANAYAEANRCGMVCNVKLYPLG